MKLQAASSTAIVNYLKIILLKYTKMERIEKYIKNDTTKFKMLFKLEFLNIDSKISGKSLQK